MEKLMIYLDNGTYDGAVIMESVASNIKAVHVKKEDVKNFSNELKKQGIYFLLIGDDEVYVGEAGIDSIENRIMRPHSDKIDSMWHSVLAFSWKNTISENELLFLENALCEYADANFSKCWTKNPSKENCNAKYRREHYHLNFIQLQACNYYLDDMMWYISIFNKNRGKKLPQKTVQSTIEEFHCKNVKRGAYGKAKIRIHTGNEDTRETILEPESVVSEEVSPKFPASQRVIGRRKELEEKGILVDRVLLEEVSFPSQSFAAEFLIGTSANGNDCWLSEKEEVKLRDLLI